MSTRIHKKNMSLNTRIHIYLLSRREKEQVESYTQTLNILHPHIHISFLFFNADAYIEKYFPVRVISLITLVVTHTVFHT